jgi:hypothetical protein
MAPPNLLLFKTTPCRYCWQEKKNFLPEVEKKKIGEGSYTFLDTIPEVMHVTWRWWETLHF